MKELRGDRRVRALVTLGTPHNGTPLAYTGLPIGRLARSLPQMMPRSAFIRRLSEGEWPGHVRLVSIYSREDWVVPASGAIVETSRGPHLRNVEVSGSHFELLTDPAIHDVILHELRRPAKSLTTRELVALPELGPVMPESVAA